MSAWLRVKVMEKMALCPDTRPSSEQHARARAFLDCSIMRLCFLLSQALCCTFEKTHELPEKNIQKREASCGDSGDCRISLPENPFSYACIP